ncbi:MAG: preprotein translocase subunit SecE [Patescibacteria group bacterium]
MDKKVPAQAFANGLVEELKRVTWPTKAETIRLTTIVIVISLIIGLYIGIIDVGLAKLLEFITKR